MPGVFSILGKCLKKSGYFSWHLPLTVFLSRHMNCGFDEDNSENKSQPQCEAKSHHCNGHGKSIEGGEVLWFKFTTRVSQMWPLDASVSIFPYHIACCVKENITLLAVWKKILHYLLCERKYYITCCVKENITLPAVWKKISHCLLCERKYYTTCCDKYYVNY